MGTGMIDDLRDAGRLPSWDLIGIADGIRDELKHTFPCRTCGARTPVRVETVDGIERCDRCYDGWPTCAICGRWHLADHPPMVRVALKDGSLGEVCFVCQDHQSHDAYCPEGDEDHD